ncbi:DUF2975 domain-containing protein [Pseudobacter ginsenosidimutans]|uniref:DUF2975 family protein n=1 Tax=Pseudobacter ginsenosidimutans TaxID=661488 RepID=A0A4Q7MU54_9BACT|nr:DUF2975 domain-containing protein [Pseudobacter ginsenosidimutans]QEC40852.1 DUF2975 domain-containing protein [Pseudobacter ginsenosidimutans]RZS72416.1 DUF2975 family protein [Pseudobacter ginsenosidimutans]
MKTRIGTRRVFIILNILSWIIFIGLCVVAGSCIFNGIYSLTINAAGADYFQLTDLIRYSRVHFVSLLLIMAITTSLQAYQFYLIVKIMMNKKLNMSQPFSVDTWRFLMRIAYLSLGSGLFSFVGSEYVKWLTEEGVQMPGLERLHLEGASIWLFMGVVLLVIANIFKRGIEIQTENDLTI